MTESGIIVSKEDELKKIGGSPLDSLRLGQYWWVTFNDKEWNSEKEDYDKFDRTELMVVENLASNHVNFKRETDRGSYSVKVRYEKISEDCKFEPDGEGVLQKIANKIQLQIQEKMKQLVEEGKGLSLLTEEGPKAVQGKAPEGSSLPAIATADPKEYKKDLISFNESLPEKTKEIEELSKEMAGVVKNITLPQKVQLESLRDALSVVDDRIFTVELYCGVLETVHLIKDGEPAPVETSLSIRQMMLFMDEETLFDYKSGGMDFNSIEKFDEWVVLPENLSRMMPEPRGIVAFRVRRNRKEYGHARSIGEAWAQANWAQANIETYLLIRNGEKVYRLATEIDFSPRLVPLTDEIGEAQFLKEDRWHRNDKKEPEKIGPDHLEYDDHVKLLDDKVKHYNRMIVLLQGLLDRSPVFAPHGTINLMGGNGIAEWVTLIRDEENALPNNTVNFKDWIADNNKGTKLGQWIYSGAADDKKRGYDTNTRPRVIQVSKTRRDGSEVRVSWPWGTRHGYEHRSASGREWGQWGEWPVDKMCHQWVKAGRFVNLNHYELGAYKDFLCDRALRGKYLEWAPFLLTAEDWKRKQIIEGKDIMEATADEGRLSKKRKRTHEKKDPECNPVWPHTEKQKVAMGLIKGSE